LNRIKLNWKDPRWHCRKV